MSKKKTNSLVVPDSNNACTICVRNGIKVYPVYHNYKWYIEVNNNGKVKRFDKSITQDEINFSMSKTYIYYADMLTKQLKK